MYRTVYIAASVVAVALSARPAAALQPFVLYNSHTNMCLQPVDGSTTQGVAIVQQPCNRTAAQEWMYVATGGGSFHLENALSQLCLDARGGAANRTPVQQWTCNQISNENWEPEVNPKGGGAPLISRVSGSSSYCLDIPGGQQTAGLAMQIYVCNETVSQSWLLNPDGSLVVPNVVNLQANAAIAKVSLYGLTPMPNNTNNPNLCPASKNGLVVDQFPGGGGFQVPNTKICLSICNGLPPQSSECP